MNVSRDELEREASYSQLANKIVAGIRGHGGTSFEWANNCLQQMAVALDDIVRQERQGWESGESMPAARLHYMFSAWHYHMYVVHDDGGCADQGRGHAQLGQHYEAQARS